MLVYFKGQLISKANCQAEDSSKKRMNKFVFTCMPRVFVCFCFMEKIEGSKKAFRNYLIFMNLRKGPKDPYLHSLVSINKTFLTSLRKVFIYLFLSLFVGFFLARCYSFLFPFMIFY